MGCLDWLWGNKKEEKPCDVEISVAVIGNVKDDIRCNIDKYTKLLFDKVPYEKGKPRQAEMMLEGVSIRFKEKEMYKIVNLKEPAVLSFYIRKPLSMAGKIITVTDDKSFFDSHESLLDGRAKTEHGACQLSKDQKFDNRDEFIRYCFADVLTAALKLHAGPAHKAPPSVQYQPMS